MGSLLRSPVFFRFPHELTTIIQQHLPETSSMSWYFVVKRAPYPLTYQRTITAPLGRRATSTPTHMVQVCENLKAESMFSGQ